MRHRLLPSLAAATLVLGLVASAGATTAGAAPRAQAPRFDAKQYLRTHGYLPLRGVATLRRAQAHANAVAARLHPAAQTPAATGRTPTAPVQWQGVAQTNVSPPDPNGAIGPNSYLETVNQKIAIYSRTGAVIASGNLTALHSGSPTDPMALWDPHTQRFYYSFLNVKNAKIDWGYSKTANPTSIPGSFCNFETSFGYATSSIPDYPKLGQTKNFLLIGVNFYASSSSSSSTSSDILWIAKSQGTAAVTTCPTSVRSGKIAGLKNADGSQAFTPVPAIQTDPSSTGFISSIADIECPPACGTATYLSLFRVTPSATTPSTPVISAAMTINVGSYTNPPTAPQSGTIDRLDTLDGRIVHSVSGTDPRLGRTAIWLAHTVAGGAGSQVNWYEVSGGGLLLQSGAVSDPTRDVFNAGISNDRACNGTTCAFGADMVVGFTTSSSSTFPADGMVSKVGANVQSAIVTVVQSTTADTGFSCSPCRWGDYGGATPDPAANQAGTTGAVWLTNQWTGGGSIFSSGDRTENWEAIP